MEIDLNKIVDVEVENIDSSDYPDFSDAFIARASLNLGACQFRDLTEKELEWLNTEKPEFVYQKILDYLF